MRRKRGQVSTEYLIIIGFVTFFIISMVGIAFFYSNTIKDRIKVTQINNFANKIISSSESVFYAGKPSKATIFVYLPDNVKKIEIAGDLIFEFQTSSGTNKVAFSSKVPLSGTLTTSPGLKKIQMEAEEDYVIISKA